MDDVTRVTHNAKACRAQTPTTTVKVSQYITGLQPATTYHYRVVATNATGTTNGNDRSFTTPKVPLSLQIVGTPNPVPFGDPFTVEGTLTATGSANHPIVLQANPFPYTAGFKTLGNPELTTPTAASPSPSSDSSKTPSCASKTLGPNGAHVSAYSAPS